MNISQIGYVDNIEFETVENENFRKVLFTGKNIQLVLMSLKPREEIGLEVHDEHDQFIRIESGEGKVIIGSEETLVSDDFAIVIPAGMQHNLINTSETEDLKLYTLYAPPEHPDGTVLPDKPKD